MNIYTLVASGKYHPVYGEDALYYRYIGKKWLIAAVMDGCSSGKDSHFISALYLKSLNKSCQLLPHMKEIHAGFDIGQMDHGAIGSFILNQLFEDVNKARKLFNLNIDEILSTILLMVFNITDRSAWVNISGDGLVVCDTSVHEIDQDNVPDYLGYHLDGTFDSWIGKHTKTMKFERIKDISISTDGITKLKPNPLEDTRRFDPIDLFLIQKPSQFPEKSLQRIYTNLLEGNRCIPYDDIGIIRLIDQ